MLNLISIIQINLVSNQINLVSVSRNSFYIYLRKASIMLW